MIKGIPCKYCDGTGETAYCHDNCKPGDKWVVVDDVTGKMACGDCLDLCSWCHGFGKLYPGAQITWADFDYFGERH